MNDRMKRLAENEILFRAVNERIVELDEDLGIDAGVLRFVCECTLLECAEPIVLALAVYERVRADPDLFIVVPGHEVEAVEDVVEANGNYAVVRKRVDLAGARPE